MDKTHITLSESEKNTISRLRQEMDLARANLANTAFQAHLAEKARDAAADQVFQINKRLEERIGEMAKDHGVDLTSDKVGKWSFDLDKMELRRLDVPAPESSAPPAAPPAKVAPVGEAPKNPFGKKKK
jgi:hypothetical protein